MKRNARLTAMLVTAASLLLYQNCTQLPDPESRIGKSSTEPFAYDAKLDQIAYMSCPQFRPEVDKDSYFTFRAGAYRTGGIKLTDDFFSRYAKKTQDAQVNAITNSAINTNTVMQIAIRDTGNYSRRLTSSLSGGNDFDNLFVQLGSTEAAINLVKAGAVRKTYLPNGTFKGAHLEGSLRLPRSENDAASVRNYLSSGQYALALTYVSAGTDADPLEPLSVDHTPSHPAFTYGTKYVMSFSTPSGAVGFAGGTGQAAEPYPNNQLASVTETSILPATTNGTWTCPQQLKLRIVRSVTDVATATNKCASGTDCSGIATCTIGPDSDADLNGPYLPIARNSLRVEDWYIDLAHKCIVPKRPPTSLTNQGTCYGDKQYVQYDVSAGCHSSTESANGNASPLCVAYVSICYRN